MSSAASDLLLHAGAVVTNVTVGVALTRDANRDERVLLGVGLVCAALLQAVDSMPLTGHGLPLAGWALLAFTALGYGLRSAAVTNALAPHPWRLTALATVVALLLHWAHTALPLQPVLTLGIDWHGADLFCAAALAGLAWLRPAIGFEGRFLLGANALALAATSFAGPQGMQLAAGFAIVGTYPLLLRHLAEDPRVVSVCGATGLAFALCCALRARAATTGLAPELPGLTDPLLLLAALFAAFGVALLAGPAARAEDVPPTPADAAPAVTLPLSVPTLVHELRTPLTSMLAAAELLAKEPDQTAHVALLKQHGQRIDATLADLEELARLAQQAVPTHCETFDFHAAVRSAVGRVAAALQSRGITIRLDIAADTPRWVQGDPTRVANLLERLVTAGAVDCALGPVDVTVLADATHLHIDVLAHQTVTVPQENLAVIYARHLTTHLGGRLQRRLRDGGGVELHATIAKVLAPGWEIDLADTDDDTPRTSQQPPARVHGRVLLVEDSPDHTRLIGHLVTRTGAEVTTAATAEVAHALLASEPFDLVLLDMQLPDKDGYATVADLRAGGATVPVVALTADSSPTDVERCLAAGCNGHLGKPVDVAALQQVLAMHLPPEQG